MPKVLPCGNEGSSQSQFGRVLRENPIEVSNFVSRFHKDCNYRLLSKDDLGIAYSAVTSLFQ